MRSVNQDRAQIELAQSERQHDQDQQELTRLKSEMNTSRNEAQQAGKQI